MRIGFDLRPLQLSSQVMGIGVYIFNLIHALADMDRESHYVFPMIEGKDMPSFRFPPSFKYEFEKLPPTFEDHLNVLRDKLSLHKIVDKYKLDVAHFTSPLELKIHFDLKSHNHRSIITIHDLTPLFYGDLIFRRKRRLLKPIFDLLVKDIPRVGNIIAVSKNTKKDLMERLNIPEEKITVIYEGADLVFRPITNKFHLQEAREKFSLPERFLLYVGGFSPHKNLGGLLEAMVILKHEYQVDIPLVIVGGTDSFLYDELKKRVEDLKMTDRVKFAGFVANDELVSFYNLAAAFVFPSFYEGFGLPLVEAMACGTPSIVSDCSSLPEVGGKAAAYFDPKNISHMAEVIHQVISNEDIAREMKAKGIIQAGSFTWERCAQETLDFYRKVALNAQM